MDLSLNSYQKVYIKRTTTKRTLQKQHGDKNSLSIFFPFTVFYFTHLLNYLFMFSKKFLCSFLPFQLLFRTNKSVPDRNLKIINCSTIYTFPSYFAYDGTIRNFHKLREYFTLTFLGTCTTIRSSNTIATANLSC